MNKKFKKIISLLMIVVPLFGCSRSNDNELAELKPVSDEILSFYVAEGSSMAGDQDPIPDESVYNLYNLYKNKPDELALKAKNKEIYSLVCEDKVHCYYVDKEVYDAINKFLFFGGPSGSSIPWRGLSAYCHHYHYLTTNFKNTKLMEIEVNLDTEEIKSKIGEFYLLDIVRFYSDTNNTDYNFVDFVDFDIKKNNALIDNTTFKSNIEFLALTYYFDLPYSALISKNPYLFSFLCELDYRGLEIETINDVETIRETFAFNQSLDAHSYDDINKCIIEKSYIKTLSHLDYYDTIFDCNKLFNLFGFK